MNYHSNEKEYFAGKLAIKKFSVYVISQEFIGRCDDKNFGYFLRTNIAGDYKQRRLLVGNNGSTTINSESNTLKESKNSLADALTTHKRATQLTCLAILQERKD